VCVCDRERERERERERVRERKVGGTLRLVWSRYCGDGQKMLHWRCWNSTLVWSGRRAIEKDNE
jgi:hypothetical protein